MRSPPNGEEVAGQEENDLDGCVQVRQWESGCRGSMVDGGPRGSLLDGKEFEAREESSASYTAFSDSVAALSRALTDRTGPGQAFARATIEISERLGARGCSRQPSRE